MKQTIIKWIPFSEKKPDNEQECFVKLDNGKILLGIYREAYKGLPEHWLLANGYGNISGNVQVVYWAKNDF